MQIRELSSAASDNTSSSLNKIRALLQRHSIQRAKLDLRLDGIKGDSRYSTALADLLHREETAGSKADPQTRAALDQKIQQMLFSETRRYFVQQSDQTQPHRVAMLEQQQAERRAVLKATAAAMRLSDSRELAMQQLLDEELRLQAHYTQHYHAIEQFNLDHAFQMQNQRLVKEWKTAEAKLNQDYHTAKGMVPSANEGASRSPSSTNGGEAEPWHAKEKQKQLIHTAPVLAPDVGAAGVALSRRKKSKQQTATAAVAAAAAANAMNQLDVQYMNTLRELKRQEEGAKRWLTRQEVRLRAQLEATKDEQALVGRYLHAEYQDIRAMRRHLDA